MTNIRTRKATRPAYVSLRRVRPQDKARVAALAITNGVSFEDQLMALLRPVLGK